MVALSGGEYLQDEAFDVVQEITSLALSERMARQMFLTDKGPFAEWDDERFEHEYVKLLVAVEGYLADATGDDEDD